MKTIRTKMNSAAIRGHEILNGVKAGRSTRKLIRESWNRDQFAPNRDFTQQWRKNVQQNLRSE